MTQQAQTERDKQLTDMSVELETQRNDRDTLRDRLRQQQVTLVSLYTQSCLSFIALMLETHNVMTVTH